MDCFSQEFIEKFIRHSKMTTINKIQNLDLTDEDISLHSDLLCMVPDYSPKIHHLDSRHELHKKYSLAHNHEIKTDIELCRSSSKTINLSVERKASSTSPEEGENSDPNRPHRKVSHCSKIMSSLSEEKRKISAISEKMIREVVGEILLNSEIQIEILEERKRREILKNVNVTKAKKRTNKFSSFYKYKDDTEGHVLDNNNQHKFCSLSPSSEDDIRNLKIFIKQEPEVTTIINFSIDYSNRDNILKDVLKQLLEENKLQPKNIHMYFFTEHTHEAEVSDINDLGKEKKYEMSLKEDHIRDNEINLETRLKDLIKMNVNKLDLYMNNYPDMPLLKCMSYYSGRVNKLINDRKYFKNACNSYSVKSLNNLDQATENRMEDKIENYDFNILKSSQKADIMNIL